jgi:hypothetical protein
MKPTIIKMSPQWESFCKEHFPNASTYETTTVICLIQKSFSKVQLENLKKYNYAIFTDEFGIRIVIAK